MISKVIVRPVSIEVGPNWKEAFPFRDGQIKVLDEEEGAESDLWIPLGEFYEKRAWLEGVWKEIREAARKAA